MANPLTTARNKYHENRKKSSVWTPAPISQFLFDICYNNIVFNQTILDPAVGQGSLLLPWFNDHWHTAGVDIIDHSIGWLDKFYNNDFLTSNKASYSLEPGLVICNPPFNHEAPGHGRQLLPELFAEKVFDIWGNGIPLILFSPMGLRLNQRLASKRWPKMRDVWPPITSIVSLPLNIFPDVEFHNEIVIFNMPYLKPHYFIDSKTFDAIRG